jgi:class 3 adenylate cyclase
VGPLPLKGIAEPVRAYEVIWGAAVDQPAPEETGVDEPARAPLAEPETQAPASTSFRTLLLTDLAGETELTRRLGDARAREVLRPYDRIVRDALRRHGGVEVHKVGDNFMVSFSSATRALECAIAIQRALVEHNEAAEEPLRVSIGLNAGEPIEEEGALFGAAIHLASRIAGRAEPGEILVSEAVRQIVVGKGFLLADRGETELRGFEDPVRLYEVRWQEET